MSYFVYITAILGCLWLIERQLRDWLVAKLAKRLTPNGLLVADMLNRPGWQLSSLTMRVPLSEGRYFVLYIGNGFKLFDVQDHDDWKTELSFVDKYVLWPRVKLMRDHLWRKQWE